MRGTARAGGGVTADGSPSLRSRSWRWVPSARPRSVAVMVPLLTSSLCQAVSLSQGPVLGFVRFGGDLVVVDVGCKYQSNSM